MESYSFQQLEDELRGKGKAVKETTAAELLLCSGIIAKQTVRV